MARGNPDPYSGWGNMTARATNRYIERNSATVFTTTGDRGAGARLTYGDLEARCRQLEIEVKRVKSEPKIIGNVLEVREDSMIVGFGPGNAVGVELVEDVRVGDRIICNRQSMQPLEIIRDKQPMGTVITVERVTGEVVEAIFLGQLRTFRAEGFTLKVGERVVIDQSMTYVLGSLGMPPAKHAVAPKITVSWDDIGGQQEAKDALAEAIELPMLHAKLFESYGKAPVKGVLLAGPPGCGKTLLAKAAATSIARAHGASGAEGFIYIKGPEVLNRFIGQSEENIRGIFSAARAHKAKHGYPAVVFLDECDALLGKRRDDTVNSIGTTTVPQFLAEMDGLDDFAAIFILATNRPDMLDPAVVREGRIDRKVIVQRPTLDDARGIFAIHLRGKPLGSGADKDMLIERVSDDLFADRRAVREIVPGVSLRLRDMASGSLIAGVVERATMIALRRDIKANAKKPTGLVEADFTTALDLVQEGLRHTNHGDVAEELIDAARKLVNSAAA